MCRCVGGQLGIDQYLPLPRGEETAFDEPAHPAGRQDRPMRPGERGVRHEIEHADVPGHHLQNLAGLGGVPRHVVGSAAGSAAGSAIPVSTASNRRHLDGAGGVSCHGHAQIIQTSLEASA